MIPTFISRLQVLVTVVAVLGLFVAAGLVRPAAAEAANEACSVQRAGAGDPATLRVRCVAKKPSAARTPGTAIRRNAKTCTIAHLGALDPAAFRLVC